MARIAGIDEAGFGPVLGPLVVSAACFDVPDERVDVSMWRQLAGGVARMPGRRHGAVVVADSKKVYSRKAAKALQHLERAVLGMLATRNRRPAALSGLLACLSPGAVGAAAAYPWYAAAETLLPCCISRTDRILAGNSLSAAMDKAGVRLQAMRAETLFVGEFNRLVGATRNKATTLLDLTSRLLLYLWRRHPGPGQVMRIYVDRHGGRQRYLRPLQRAFPRLEFAILREDPDASVYRMQSPGRTAELHFSVGGEDKHLPVALASMTGKYLRELFMAMLNSYWAQRVPGIKSTAGYYVDGRRFLRQIRPAVRDLGLDERMLARAR